MKVTITWPKIFGSSLEQSRLPFYDAYTVAKLQRWFGLYPNYASFENNGHPPSVTKNYNHWGGEKNTGQGQLEHPGENFTSDDDEAGKKDEAPCFIAQNKLWYYLFSFGAWLGDDSFYFVVFSLVISNLSWWVSRRMLLIWGICMYIGQAAKEMLKWPRPSEPPVVRLERRYFMEYGMPSTHAIVGTLMPFTFLFGTWDHYEYSHTLGTILAFSWAMLVCFSRLYKGMHFILDLVAGVTITLVLMLLLWPWLDQMDHFLLTHPQAPLVVISTSVFLCIIYPCQNGVASTRADTITILSAVSGALCGFWFNYRIGMLPDALAPLGGVIGWPGWTTLGLMLIKYLMAQLLTAVMYLAVRAFLLQAIPVIYNIEINERTKRLLFVELPYRYINYFGVGAFSYVIIPLLFQKLNLD
ncbi:sphingosine-1-phosphate phosphatase 2-like [Asterias amurensis]|uniref:sphingosine-1-phosphate phosphatase 2-like n=1 Tax=Asterias amurensis TaxID=7602 RepID=UPI003AB17D82